MPLVSVPIAGPSHVLRSVNADVERTINFYVETTAPGTGKVPAYLIGTPGLRVWQTLPDAPIRGTFQQDDRAFVVAGASFFEVSNIGPSATFYGTVVQDANMATMASNGSAGHQVAITSGGQFYIFDLNANTLTHVVTGVEPVTMCEFMDGYFLVNKTDSRTFAFSALEDGTSWDPLDVNERSEASDNIIAMVRNHREIWLLGSQTSEVWFNQGDPLTPFAPIQGVFVEQGCSAPFSVQRIDNTILWVGLNVDGAGIVWRANGYTPQRVSTYAVERALEQTGFEDNDNGLTLMRGWCYQEDGHLFYVLVLPDASLPGDKERTSWAYDISTGAWCERARWDSTHCVWIPHVAQTHMFAFNRHLVGDRFSGAIYTQSLSFFDETIVSP